jgi:hypothetical protein
MFYLKFLPILEQILSKTYFNLLLLNHFTSKGKNKTSLKDDRNKCQKSHQIGIEQVNSKENDAHILKKYREKEKKNYQVDLMPKSKPMWPQGRKCQRMTKKLGKLFKGGT